MVVCFTSYSQENFSYYNTQIFACFSQYIMMHILNIENAIKIYGERP